MVSSNKDYYGLLLHILKSNASSNALLLSLHIDARYILITSYDIQYYKGNSKRM
jgi:hypothetical protein